MPQQWIKAFKFEWELPYNSWLLRLKRADLKPNVLEKPKIIGFEGRKVLKAKIKAISNNIFIVAPGNIEVTGDLREELVSEDMLSPELSNF